MSERRLKVGLVTLEGTNCDRELASAFDRLGATSEVIHLKQLEHRGVEPGRRRSLDDFGLVMIPGGFSAGDHIRAGAIFAARMRAAIGDDLESFVRSGRLLGGICNGFQVLTELGLLPGRPDGRLGPPQAALMTNDSGRYECRPTWVAWEGGRFAPLSGRPAGERFMFPSGHGEGKLVLPGPRGERLDELTRSGQVLFRWANPLGGPVVYPWNPNGSEGHVAGVTNPAGNVFGLMPHPERAFDRVMAPDWTRTEGEEDGPGDGRRFLAAVVDEARRRS